MIAWSKKSVKTTCSAAVVPDKVDGWVFAKVPVEENGKTVDADKLLKPFNLQ